MIAKPVNPPPLAAVTGATGFLGQQIVAALAADGWRVRVLARRDPAGIWGDLNPEVVRGNLHDPAALSSLCAGAETVIHAAALVKARRQTDFNAVNIDGALNLAKAACQAQTVLLVSSLAAREPHLSAYAASKRQAETAMAEALGNRLTIARPPAIYGPADRELLPVFRAANSSPLLPVLSAEARLALIHVSDAARQIAALAARPAAGQVWALSDARPEGYGWRELIAAAAAACGRDPRLTATPRALVRGLGLAGDLAAALGATPMLTSGKVRELLHPDWTLSPSERAPDLPPPAYDLLTGFADTVAWYRSAAWMKQ